MSEMVYVGSQKLVGEVIALDKDLTTIQVYEETTGLRPGEEVVASGNAVSVTLAPGILNNIFDGIQRPLERIADAAGAFITRGVSVDSLDREKKWSAHITVKEGQYPPRRRHHRRSAGDPCYRPQMYGSAGRGGNRLSVVPDGEYTIEENACHLGAVRRF